MKIVHTSDWHVGKTIRGRSRLPEHEAVLAEIAEIAARESADVVIVAGDLFDSAAPAPDAEHCVYRALLALANTGATVAVLAGNHDSERRLHAVAPLLELGRVIVRALPSRDGLVELDARTGERLKLAMLPWVGKHHVVRAEQLMNLSAAENEQEYASRIARIIKELCTPMSAETVNVLAAHLTIVGADPGEEVRDAHAGIEYAVPATIFPPSLHYVALGHFHTPQAVSAPCPAWYAGSPLHLGFGNRETEEASKAAVVIDAEPGRPAQVRAVPLTQGRRTRTIAGTLDELESITGRFGDDYLRVFVKEQARAGLSQQVREWFPDAVDVRVDPGLAPVEEERRSRRGRRPRELFVDFLTEKNAFDERVVALFDRLLEEANAPDPA